MLQNFIAKLSPQEKKLMYVTVIVVLLTLLDRLFFGPVMSQLRSLDNDIAQNKQIIKRDLRFLKYKDRILREDEAFRIYYGKKFATEEEIIASFLKSIESKATNAGINLIKVNPSDSQVQKGYMEYYANLECNGALEDIVKFMYAIDTSEEMLRIIKFDMSPKRGAENEVQAVMKVAKIIIDYDPKKDKDRKTFLKGGEGFFPEKKKEKVKAGTAVSSSGVIMSEQSSTVSSAGGAVGGPEDISKEKSGGAGRDMKSAPLSERYQVKGKLPGKKKIKKAPKSTEADEIKPSVWERLMNSEKKDKK